MRPKSNTKIRAYRTALGLVAIEFEDINGEKETLRFTDEEEARGFIAKIKEALTIELLPK